MGEMLPLSWTINDGIRPRYHHVLLPLSRVRWITFAEIPSCFSHQVLYEDIVKTFPEGYVIRGCTPEIGKLFSTRKCHVMRTGAEAVLDPANKEHLQKKSVLSSLSRGKKQGFVEEIRLDDNNRQCLEAFRRNTIHAGKSQLKNLFRNNPSNSCRCFVFRAFSGKWFGAITISERGPYAMHTELMLRDRKAPGDIMECLVAGIFEILNSEGTREWSLGEVPFMQLLQDNKEKLNNIENLSASIGKRCRHVYDFEGLYRFKNKFVPEWRPVMLCTDTLPTPLMLMELSDAMGFTGLLIDESISLLRKWFIPV